MYLYTCCTADLRWQRFWLFSSRYTCDLLNNAFWFSFMTDKCTQSKIITRKYLWPKLFVTWTSHLRDITGLFKVRLFAVILLWIYFITHTVITHQSSYYTSTHTASGFLFMSKSKAAPLFLAGRCNFSQAMFRWESSQQQCWVTHCSDLLPFASGNFWATLPANTLIFCASGSDIYVSEQNITYTIQTIFAQLGSVIIATNLRAYWS